MWDVIVLIPDHCLSIYFVSITINDFFATTDIDIKNR